MKLKHADDWKAQYERAQDKGNEPDLRDLIGDVQINAIKFTLAKAKREIKNRVKKLPLAAPFKRELIDFINRNLKY